VTSLAFNVGDIVLVSFPFSDGQSTKKRPALVMSPPDAYGDVLLIAITSNPDTPGGIPIAGGDLVDGQLTRQSWVKPEKVNAIEVRLIQRVLGRVKPSLLTQVRATLCPVLGCH
jgi:mRNA interferase MazF